MKIHVTRAAALTVSALCFAPVATLAQSAPAVAPPAAVAAAVRPDGHPGMAKAQTERLEAHIVSLGKQLRVTAAQQTQWDQFAAVMRENAREMTQSFDERLANLASMNAADNMQSYARMTAQHAQDVQRLSQAFQSLYSTFSDDQKKNADAIFRVRAEQHAHG